MKDNSHLFSSPTPYTAATIESRRLIQISSLLDESTAVIVVPSFRLTTNEGGNKRQENKELSNQN